MPLSISISNRSGVPIYQQIVDQIRSAIIDGDLKEGDPLPSIRSLARDLQVSVMSTTRAYSELSNAGFIVNVPGKGSYVQSKVEGLIREDVLRKVENHLEKAVALASTIQIDGPTIRHMFDLVLGEGEVDD